MDNSKEYIKMCKAAEEIQDFFGKKENRKGITIHYFFQEDAESTAGEIFVKQYFHDCFAETKRNTKTVWLPSQDHLQDMCKGQTIFDAINDFHRFVFIPAPSQGRGVMITKRCAQFTTGEQLWLAFLYHSTLQKRWNGEKWERFSLSYRYKET